MSINLIFNHHVLNSPYTQGYISYLVDVMNTIDREELNISMNSTNFHKYTILFHEIAKPLFIRGYTPEYIVRVLHSGELELPEDDLRFYDKSQLIYFTQYKDQCQFLKDNGFTCYFFPMRINTDTLPKTATKNGKWIYFGNLYPNKLDTLESLKSYLNFDILSFSKLNDGDTVLTHEQCLNLVSQYSYGIGVGRCALEMVGMGLPVLLTGKNLGGTLVTSDDFIFHRNCNFNTSLSNSTGITNDIQKIQTVSLGISKTDIDLDLNNWITVLT